MTSPHEHINAPDLARPVGFSHAVAPVPGRTVFLAGQVGHDGEGNLVGDDLVTQFDAACRNLVIALEAAGGAAEDMVSLQIFTTDVPGYRKDSEEIGETYRAHFGDHYPAIALLGVDQLFDPGAVVELVGIAVVPDHR